MVPHPNHRFKELQQAYIQAFSPKEDEIEPSYCGAAEILAAKYDVANVDEVADAQHHLTPKQCHELKFLLRQFPILFSGKLGLYPHCKIHLNLDLSAWPER